MAPEPLQLTVHGIAPPDLSDPAQAAPQRTRNGRLKMLLVLLACAAPVIASYFTYFVIRPEGRTNFGTLMLPTRALPDLALRTLGGEPVAARSLHGQWLLVAVGPSTCTTACQKQLFMQRQLREMLGREKDRLDKVWLVTDEGAIDPLLLASLQAAPEVIALRAGRDVVHGWLEPAAADASVDPQLHLYIVDPMGELMMRMPAEPDPSRVKRDLGRLLRASSSWDNAGR